jgi:hypothetical protein
MNNKLKGQKLHVFQDNFFWSPLLFDFLSWGPTGFLFQFCKCFFNQSFKLEMQKREQILLTLVK